MGTDQYLEAIAKADPVELVELVREREKTWARFAAAERAYWQALARPYPANRYSAQARDREIDRIRLTRDRIAKELGIE